MIQRKYGRKIPAALPPHRMLIARDHSLPQAADLRPWTGPMKNQQTLGSCTGHGFSTPMEWIFRRYFKKQPVLSPLYLYSWELITDGTFPNDEGSTGTTGANVSIIHGCCEDSLYPDASLQIVKPTDAQNENAKQYSMGAYHGLTGSMTALTVVANEVPWPVEVGFTVYESFESEEVAKTGIYSPGPGEAVLGGHEVCMMGYDIGPTPTIRPAGAPPSALIQNSWGSEWGDKGFFWMDIRVLDDPQTDLKIIHTGHPW